MEGALLSYIVFSLTDCIQGEFMCDVKRCISLSDRCNGHDDCEDQTDEQDCESRFIDNIFCDLILNITCLLVQLVC